MIEHKRLQVFELANCIVRGTHRLITFISTDSNTNIGLGYHADIIGTISDG